MGAFTSVTKLHEERVGSLKVMTLSALGPASYDSGGSTIDLSSATFGTDNAFTIVDCVVHGGIAAASSKYDPVYVRATAGAAATGKVKVHDTSQAADAEASGDLSAVTFYFVAFGR